VEAAEAAAAVEEEEGNNFMKQHIIKILLIPFIGLLFSGCYTALWMPDGNYDSEDIQANEGENYYTLNDYGDYYYFYNRPWWYSAVQAAQAKKDRTNDTNTLRNGITGRNDFTRDRNPSGGSTNAPLPTVSAPAPAASTSSNTSSTKDNSGNRVESTSSSNSSNKSSNNSNPVRNNDGNRNTNGR